MSSPDPRDGVPSKAFASEPSDASASTCIDVPASAPARAEAPLPQDASPSQRGVTGLFVGFLESVEAGAEVDFTVILSNLSAAPLREIRIEPVSLSNAAMNPLVYDEPLRVSYGRSARLAPGGTWRAQARYRLTAEDIALGGEIIASLILRAESNEGWSYAAQLDAFVLLDGGD